MARIKLSTGDDTRTDEPDDTWTDELELELGRPLPDGAESAADHTGRHTPEPAPALIDGILRRGHKMMITGAPKTGKSWFAINLAWSIVTGGKLLDRFQCERGHVVYVNAELDRLDFWIRANKVAEELDIPDTTRARGLLSAVHTRGMGLGMEGLADKMIDMWEGCNVALVIIDPVYKYERGSENDLETVRILASEMDRIAETLSCSVVYVHHHAKGQAGARSVEDRGAGSGGFARDYDAHIDLTRLWAEKGSSDAEYIEKTYGSGAEPFCAEFSLRSFKNPGPISVIWKWPLFTPVDDEAVASLPLVGSPRANSRKGGESTKRANDSRKHRENLRMGRAIEQCKASGEKHDRRGVFPIYCELAEEDGEVAPGYETFKSWTQPGGRLAYRVDRENDNVLVPKRADQD